MVNPTILENQLLRLNLTFDDEQIQTLNDITKFTAIDGIDLTAEEMKLAKESANNQVDIGGDYNHDFNTNNDTSINDVQADRPTGKKSV